jgi:DNA-binding MarR family transcriptional regulator
MRQASDLEVATWHAVGRSYHRCVAALSDRVAPLGLNLTAHEVLQHLLRTPGLSQQRLAARVFTAKSHLSSVVRDLESRGLLQRLPDPSDARAWSLSLTTKGQSLARRGEELQLSLIASMGEGVSQADHARFASVLAHIESNLIAMSTG